MTVFPMACCMPHLLPTVTAADWGPKLSAVRTHTMLLRKLQTKQPGAQGARRMKEGSHKISALTMLDARGGYLHSGLLSGQQVWQLSPILGGQRHRPCQQRAQSFCGRLWERPNVCSRKKTLKTQRNLEAREQLGGHYIYHYEKRSTYIRMVSFDRQRKALETSEGSTMYFVAH